jgi:hypothetical protein
MANKPTDLPQWASAPAAGDVVEPIAAEKASGFLAFIKPAHQTSNWLLNNLYTWMQYLGDGTLEPTIRVKSKVVGDNATGVFRITDFANNDKLSLLPGDLTSVYGGGGLSFPRADDATGSAAQVWLDVKHTGGGATNHTYLVVSNLGHASARCTTYSDGGFLTRYPSPNSGLRYSYSDTVQSFSAMLKRIDISPHLGSYMPMGAANNLQLVGTNTEGKMQETSASTAEHYFRYHLREFSEQNVSEGIDGTTGKTVWRVTSIVASLYRQGAADVAAIEIRRIDKPPTAGSGTPADTLVTRVETTTNGAFVNATSPDTPFNIDPRYSYYAQLVLKANSGTGTVQVRQVYMECSKFGVE